ncbi:MAG TPA: flagellar FliJ family protein [Polyangiaceae bacterium]|nr:flagellar FliJ family protein [Polyangiaceae bacterium]
MSPRRARVKRIITIREKQLDDKVKALRQEQRALAEATERAENERQRLSHATAERQKLESTGADAKSWLEADEWLATRASLLDKARKHAETATVAVDRARGHVRVAQINVKRVELLSERMEEQERTVVERAAQRLEDEIAAHRFEQALERGKQGSR